MMVFTSANFPFSISANRLLLLTLLILGLGGCKKGPIMAEYFPFATPDTDTIHIFPHASPAGLDPIPHSELAKVLDFSLLGEEGYEIPDSLNATLYGHWILPVEGGYTFYLLEVQEAWFVYKYILAYSSAEQNFVTAFPVAQFYGGEGGQIWIESHLADWKDGTSPTIVVRKSEHALVMMEYDFEEFVSDGVKILQWEGGQFIELPLTDEDRLINAYPVKW